MQKRQMLRNEAIKYAQQIRKPVFLSWVDGSKREYQSTMKTVELCYSVRIAACIVGAECEDKTLEKMLNALLDSTE